MTNDQIKSGGELKACGWCGSPPYSVPQTCEYSRPGVVHRYRILCPNCETQTGECITPEAAIRSWQAGYAYVPLAVARTPAKPGEDGVERVARALCELRIRQVRKHDTAQDRIEEMMPAAVDHAWRDHEEEARVAIAALHGDQEG